MTTGPVRVYAGTVDALGSARCVAVADDPSLTIWRLTDGTLIATDDACPHYFWSLRTVGEVGDDVVTCGVHLARFDLRSGRCLDRVTRRSLATYPVETSPEGDLHVVKPGAPAP